MDYRKGHTDRQESAMLLGALNKCTRDSFSSEDRRERRQAAVGASPNRNQDRQSRKHAKASHTLPLAGSPP